MWNSEKIRMCIYHLYMKPVPDKGWCWVMFFASCVIMFMVFGAHYTYGILFPSLLKEFNQGEEQTACIGSMASGLLFFSSFFAVKVSEYTSATTTTLIGSIFCGCGLIFTSVAQEFQMLYFTYGILFGVGSSFMYTPCLIMVGKWFDKYQSVTTGVCSASAALGSLILSPLTQYALRLNGLRQTIRYCGVIYLTVGILCSLCYRPLDNTTHYKDTNILIACRNTERKTKNILKKKRFLFFLVVMMITNFCYYVPIIHLINYVESFGISTSSASLLISIWSVSTITGRVVYGKVMGHFRKHLLVVYKFSMFCSGVVSILAFLANSYWMFCAYVILYGFLDGSFVGLLSLMMIKISGNINVMANYYGLLLTMIGFPIAAGPPLIGLINDRNWLPPSFMFILAGSLFITGAFLMHFVERVKENITTSNIVDIISEYDDDKNAYEKSHEESQFINGDKKTGGEKKKDTVIYYVSSV